MSSCCRGAQKDPNLEFFEAVERLSFALANREEDDLKDDAGSNIRWAKYQRLVHELRRVEQIAGKSYDKTKI